MKSLRKSIRDSRLRTNDAVTGWLKPRMGVIGTRCRLAARIRKANRWATRHPKRTFGYVVGTLLFILLGDVAVTGARLESREPNISTIAQVEPIFSGFRNIQAGKETQRRQLIDMTDKGRSLHRQLDSLIAIPRKSHSDSIEIIRRYRSLEQIVKSLKQHDNNEKD